MRKILVAAGLAVLLSGCGEKAILRKRLMQGSQHQNSATH